MSKEHNISQVKHQEHAGDHFSWYGQCQQQFVSSGPMLEQHYY
jgi:hypothetical protein